MPETSWLQNALEDAIQETNAVEDKIGLARLAILEKLVSPASPDRHQEDELLDALDELRAIDWERLSQTTEQLVASVG